MLDISSAEPNTGDVEPVGDVTPHPMRRRLWPFILGALLIGFAATTLVLTKLNEPEKPEFCPADGIMAGGPDGEVLGRSPDAYCCFVDENGDVVRVDDICRRLRAG